MIIHIDRTASGYTCHADGTSPRCNGHGATMKEAVGDLIVSFPASHGITLCFDFNAELPKIDDSAEIDIMMAAAVREFLRP